VKHSSESDKSECGKTEAIQNRTTDKKNPPSEVAFRERLRVITSQARVWKPEFGNSQLKCNMGSFSSSVSEQQQYQQK
jgi:hypothetical protein